MPSRKKSRSRSKSRYSKNSFHKDLKQLSSLVNQYKGGSAGVKAFDPSGLKWGKTPQRPDAAAVNNLGLNQPNLPGAQYGSYTAPVTGAVTGGAKRPKKRSVAKRPKKSSAKVDRRSFTIVEVDNKKIPQGEGRYTIKTNSNQTPSNAARKACTKALSKRNKNKLVIKVRETTSGSDKKVKCYNCSRSKLKTPIKIDRPGQSKPQIITHKTTVKEVSK